MKCTLSTVSIVKTVHIKTLDCQTFLWRMLGVGSHFHGDVKAVYMIIQYLVFCELEFFMSTTHAVLHKFFDWI